MFAEPSPLCYHATCHVDPSPPGRRLERSAAHHARPAQRLLAVSRIVPLQYYLGMVRSIMIKGAGMADLWPQVAALSLLALVMGLVAWRSVARRLE
jgi:hypothetical protein